MTLSELKAVWQRYIHRTDLSADTDTVYTLISEQIPHRLISFPDVDMDTILATYPRMLVHGGLAYLHELAQDDEGMQREMMRTDDAIRDFSLWYSIYNDASPAMSRPYYPNGG